MSLLIHHKLKQIFVGPCLESDSLQAGIFSEFFEFMPKRNNGVREQKIMTLHNH